MQYTIMADIKKEYTNTEFDVIFQILPNEAHFHWLLQRDVSCF